MEAFNQFFASGGGMIMMMFIIIYFFMIAPQLRRSKKEKRFLSGLKTGDRVVMKSGMHGRVNDINAKEGTCMIETTAGKLKFNSTMISMDASNKLNK